MVETMKKFLRLIKKKMGAMEYNLIFMKKIAQVLPIVVILTGVFSLIVYLIVPKESWINFHATPTDFHLTDVSGLFFGGETRSLQVDGEFSTPLYLQVPTTIFVSSLGGEPLFSKTLPAKTTIYLDYDEYTQQDVLRWDTDYISMSFSKPTKFQKGSLECLGNEVIYDEEAPTWYKNDLGEWETSSIGKIQILGDAQSEKKQQMYMANGMNKKNHEAINSAALENVNIREPDDQIIDYVSFLNCMVDYPDAFYFINYFDEVLFVNFNISAGTELEFHSPMNVLIPNGSDICHYSGCVVSLVFEEDNDEFLVPCNKTIIDIKESSYVGTFFMEGKCEQFTAMPSNANDSLKYIYLDNQKEYDVERLLIEGKSRDRQPFSVSCFLPEGKTELQISGPSSSVAIANTSLSYSIAQFVADNQGSIILGFFGTVMAAYITLIQTNHSKESPDGNDKKDDKAIAETEKDGEKKNEKRRKNNH